MAEAATGSTEPMPTLGTPRQVLAPLQKVTPRQQAVADELVKVPVVQQIQVDQLLTTAVLDDGGEVVPLVNPEEQITDKDLTILKDAEGTSLDVSQAQSNCSSLSLPQISNMPVTPGTIIGDEDHLFWRKGLEVHVRVWELSDPVCYAAQLHTACPRKKHLGVLYLDKQSVDESLDSSYILNGSSRVYRATIDAADLKGKKAQAIVDAGDSDRIARHREAVVSAVLKNMNIRGEDESTYSVTLAEKGGKPSPFRMQDDDITGKVRLQPRKFEVGKPSRADIIKNFQKVSADFHAQLENVKSNTGHSSAAAKNSGMILDEAAHMTSPARLQSVLAGIKKKSLVKLTALNAFKLPRKTL